MRKKNVAAAVIVLLAVLLGGCGNKGDVQETDPVIDAAALTEEEQGEVAESVSETSLLTEYIPQILQQTAVCSG